MTLHLRYSDSNAEQEVSKFLDKNFYAHYVKNPRRMSSKKEQLSGIDIKFDYKNELELLVDEKAMVHYVNQNLPTFAFEISFCLSSGDDVEGWLFDSKKLTQYYLIAWIWAEKKIGFSEKDITKLEILLIKRQSVLDMLNAHGISREDANGIISEIRKNNQPGYFRKDPNRVFNFFYSKQLLEKPINIIVKKTYLEKLAIAKHIISR